MRKKGHLERAKDEEKGKGKEKRESGIEKKESAYMSSCKAQQPQKTYKFSLQTKEHPSTVIFQ